MSQVDGFEPWVVLLAGGIGSRFWPASTPQRPKQFLPLASSQPLIRDTLERAHKIAPAERTMIVAGEHLRSLLAEYEPDFPTNQILIEPEPRGTAAALAWAASEIVSRSERPERAVMVAMPSDHVIRPLERFVQTIERAVSGAGSHGKLLTVGVRPSRPETGYGYIQVGEALDEKIFSVVRFVEKPDLETAQDYLTRGGFLWNSGIFIWRPEVLLDELEAHTREIADQLSHLERGDVPAFFGAVPAGLTIDYGLMERSSNMAVVEAEFEWDDVGSWGALVRVRETDADGNVSMGSATIVECNDSIIWAEDGPVVGFGLERLIVARASGITFVAPLDRADDLKKLLEQLPDSFKRGEG